MNFILPQCVGKKIIGFVRDNESKYWFTLLFDDGSKLTVKVEAECCDDAWLHFEFDTKKAPISEG